MPGFRSWSAASPARADTSSFRQGCVPGAASDQGRHPRALRLAEDEPPPDLSVFPLRKVAELTRYVTSRFACRRLSGARDHSRQSGGDGRAHAGIRLRCSPVPAQPRRRQRTGRRVAREQLVQRRPRPAKRRSARRDPTLRCVMPTREQPGLPTDIQVMRTVAKHANRCLGIADGEQPGHHRCW